MRVITGSARGRVLYALEGDDVRPTTDRIKEALFSIIQFEIEGRKVLDLFAGSGQLGIEALSRGAKSAVFVDSSKKSIEVVQKNLELTGLSHSAKVLCREGVSFLKTCAEKFDVVFLDPPYSTGILQNALSQLDGVLNEDSAVICEAPKQQLLPEKIKNGEMTAKRYEYGKIALTVYKNRGETDVTK